jgi:hypothetical protein
MGFVVIPRFIPEFARLEISWNPQRIPDIPSDFMEDSVAPLVY